MLAALAADVMHADGNWGGRAGCLVANLQVETDESVRQIVLNRDRFTIGRLSTNDIVIPRQQISRYHAELRSTPDGWWIADLESTNGLQVDGLRVQRHLLREGMRVQLAPGVFIGLVRSHHHDDLAVRPTESLPALSAPSQGQRAEPAGVWRPATIATAWGAFAAGMPGIPGGSGTADSSTRVEGDLFRRKRVHDSGAPTGDALRSASTPVYGTAASYLHLCQTCGQQTAPGGVHCQACGSPIARPCGGCMLSLLPIQDLCPRCQTPNPASVLRSRQTPTSA